MLEYHYSKEVDPATLAASSSFSRFSVRVHLDDSKAQRASKELVREWRRARNCTFSSRAAQLFEVGHYVSLVLPECLPKRLPFITKIIDYEFLEDDLIESGFSEDQRQGTYAEMADIPEFNALKTDLRSTKAYKKFQTRLVVECIETLGHLPFALIEIFMDAMAANANNPTDCESLEEYMAIRLPSSGYRMISTLICCAMNIRLSAEDEAHAHNIVKPLEVAVTLSNDYYSYAKEQSLHDQQRRPGTAFNGVAVLMAQHSIPEEEALAQLKLKILEAEEEHSLELERHEQERPLSNELRNFVAAFQMFTAGHSFWYASGSQHRQIVQDSYYYGTIAIVTNFWGWVKAQFGFA